MDTTTPDHSDEDIEKDKAKEDVGTGIAKAGGDIPWHHQALLETMAYKISIYKSEAPRTVRTIDRTLPIWMPIATSAQIKALVPHVPTNSPSGTITGISSGSGSTITNSPKW